MSESARTQGSTHNIGSLCLTLEGQMLCWTSSHAGHKRNGCLTSDSTHKQNLRTMFEIRCKSSKGDEGLCMNLGAPHC
jgi:hypothetical protein